jgi:hypothetical protein
MITKDIETSEMIIKGKCEVCRRPTTMNHIPKGVVRKKPREIFYPLVINNSQVIIELELTVEGIGVSKDGKEKDDSESGSSYRLWRNGHFS